MVAQIGDAPATHDPHGTNETWTANRASELAATVEGWLSEAQGRALFEAAAAATGRGAVVEIGSWKGRSTVWLAAGARLAGQRLYAIDPHTGSREDPGANTLTVFLENLRRAGLSDAVHPLVMTSAAAAAELRGPVELLFVDGDHRPAGVKGDAAIWLPRLVDGALVAFHDVATAGYTGPRRVFQRSICRSRQFDSIARVGSMCIARRTPRRNRRAAVWGFTVNLLLYFYDLQRLFRRVTRPVAAPFRARRTP